MKGANTFTQCVLSVPIDNTVKHKRQQKSKFRSKKLKLQRFEPSRYMYIVIK